jgi:hypothetical protein
MSLHDFIFSEIFPHRVWRHILFWSTRMFTQFILFIAGYLIAESLDGVVGLLSSPIVIIAFIGSTIIEIISCYVICYQMIPKLLGKGKYWTFAITLLLFSIGLFAVMLVPTAFVFESAVKGDLTVTLLWNLQQFLCRGPLVICGLFLVIKMLKTWLVESEHHLTLLRENINAELQLLKAQVHPHFLFNTLNNIFSHTLNESNKAIDLIGRLSNILIYMIYDCGGHMVPLEKELGMIRDYLALEKVRYGDRLKMKVKISGDVSHNIIAPLLLIPFVENSFKHGASRVLNEPWIKMTLEVKASQFHFALANNRPLLDGLASQKGLGLANVSKRLALIYPGTHNLTIRSTEDSWEVDLRITLDNDDKSIHNFRERKNLQNHLAYADR